ncbi:class I SAM-dependent methyltransferase [Amycolatopsis sp. SID8362]|uniref:class I SAM-dependent methyltransferase n=1 Tax=Amycolatopsis sp. SID8362 TaxID=2690346 RepID=UPI00137221E6|nr:class I SAM-dependent methyltransferase [Amycolatopsis sp. SID8362]NBH08912.1 methyltransferase domain-containing protein [Amycolatopsis sp. SID8362]NED45604.1 class I SAM-dependent methyltransferase [Amycolatopsis sp. SID8362]
MDHDSRAALFDSTAEHYDEDPWHASVAEALVSPLPESPELVLDVATGTGFAAYAALRLKPARVLAVDLSPAMLARATAKAATLDPAGVITWQVAPAVPMPAADGSADVVLCASSLHFLGAVAFADWLRVLRPGGRLAFSVVSGARFKPTGRFADFVPRDLSFPTDEAGAAELATSAGFVDASAQTFTVEGVDRVRSVFLVYATAP